MDDRGSAEAKLAVYAAALADGVTRAIGPWVVTSVVRVADEQLPGSSAALLGPAEEAAQAATREVAPAMAALLAQDVEEQRTNPLALVRAAVWFPTRVLVDAEVPPVVRDAFAVEMFPDDHYDLTPGSFAQLDPELGDVGVAWGAAKAFVIRARHRP